MARPALHDEPVLEFIRAYTREHGYSPNLREVAGGTGLASASSAKNVVLRLQQAGELRYTPGVARGIVLAAPQR